MEAMIGREVKGYEIRDKIGEGGFGAVYVANQPNVGREVAVKIILPEFANQPEFIRRFESEAQIVARLEHPHIVPLYDYWRDPSGAYLVMRLFRGGSLRESLSENGAWQAREVLQLVNQISLALTFAHSNGVIHRDLKSDNILLDKGGNTYLSDFGIAKDLGSERDLTKDAILGTPAYLAPEQIRGEKPSIQSDIYALGILTYEALTGSKPFVENSPAALLYKQLNDPLPYLQESRPDLPDDLNIVLQRATAKDADLRYASALDFARDFQSVIREASPGVPASGSGTLTLDMMSITQAEQEIFEPKNPYKGLRAFQQADSKDFYGRDELIERLRLSLAVDGDNHDFLAVVGPSGSGKSSVVKAGLLPRIQENVLDPELNWYATEMVPGTHPLEELEAALLGMASTEMPGLLEQLREDERGLVRAIKRLLPDDQSEFVLVIDQFEEVFTLVESEDVRMHFLNTILKAVLDSRSRIKIIITIRADFYDRPLLYTDFGDLIRNHTELVLPLTETELREAIIGPVRRIGVDMEQGLMEAIVADVQQQPGALPMLQYALTELFERREDRLLKLATYQDIGGTTGALARRADEIYLSFDDKQKAAARQMFLRLVQLGEGTEDTRRRVFQDELLSMGTQAAAMRNVIDTYGEFRLLTFDHDPQNRRATVEVAHEALIRQWQRLRSWLDESRESLRQQRRLSTAAHEWQQANRDPSYLVRGARLTQFEEWSERSNLALNTMEGAFLNASIAAREDRIRAEREQIQREEQLRRAARRRLQILAGGSIIAAVVGIALAIVAFTAQQNAEEARQLALQKEALAAENALEAENQAQLSRSLALAANARNAQTANNNPQLALALALEAKDAYEPVQAEVARTLASAVYAPGPRHRFEGHDGSVIGVAISSDGMYTLSAAGDGTVRKWNNRTGAVEFVVASPNANDPDAPARFYDVDIHPNDENFAVVGSEGIIYLHDFETGELLFTYDAHEGDIYSIAYSPDGRFLLTGGLDKIVREWGIASRLLANVYIGHFGAVTRVAYSANGDYIVTASVDEDLSNNDRDDQDRSIRIWDNNGNEIERIQPDLGFIRGLAVHPTDNIIAYTSYTNEEGGTIHVINLETVQEIRRFFASGSPITDLAYSPDGSQLASVGFDQIVHLWDVERGNELANYSGFHDRVLSVDFSPLGNQLALGVGNVGDNEFTTDRSVDNSVWLWDIVGTDQLVNFDRHNDWVWAVDISPDDRRVASAGGPFNLRMAQIGEAFEPNDTNIYVWEATTGNVEQVLSGHSNTVESVQFHPTENWLLSASWDGLIIMWNLENGTRLDIYRGHEGAVNWVRFNADGTQFISAGADGKAIIWDTASGDRLMTLDDSDGAGLNSAVWNPDETRIATGAHSPDNTIRIYDAQTGNLLRAIAGHTSRVHEVLFHPTNDEIVSSSWDGTVRVWNTTTGRELRQFFGHTGHTFGLAFDRSGDFLLTTAEDATVRLWDYYTTEELHRFDEHTSWVLEVDLSSDDSFLVSAAEDDTARLWRLDTSADALGNFARETRYIYQLTCNERAVYRLDPCSNTDAR